MQNHLKSLVLLVVFQHTTYFSVFVINFGTAITHVKPSLAGSSALSSCKGQTNWCRGPKGIGKPLGFSSVGLSGFGKKSVGP